MGQAGPPEGELCLSPFLSLPPTPSAQSFSLEGTYSTFSRYPSSWQGLWWPVGPRVQQGRVQGALCVSVPPWWTPVLLL